MISLTWQMRLAAVLGTCGIVVLWSSPAAAQVLGFTSSLNGARGTYPLERVDSVYLFNGVDIGRGPFRVAVTIPWMRLETTPSGVVDGAIEPLAATTTGFGDPLFRCDVRVLDDRSRALQVGVAASIKPPVVDAGSGRGTGEADYAVGFNVFKTISRTSLMSDVLFWKYGDPVGVDFADAWSYSVAAAQILGDGRWSAIASVAGFSAGVAGAPAPVAVNVSMLRLVTRGQSLGVVASFGLNEGSNDFSLGTTWRISR